VEFWLAVGVAWMLLSVLTGVLVGRWLRLF